MLYRLQESMDSTGNMTHISQWVAKKPKQPFFSKRRTCLCVLCSVICSVLALLFLGIIAAYIVASVKFPELIHPKAFECPAVLVQSLSNRNEPMCPSQSSCAQNDPGSKQTTALISCVQTNVSLCAPPEN